MPLGSIGARLSARKRKKDMQSKKNKTAFILKLLNRGAPGKRMHK
jgi:hypothetical protein